MKHDTTLCPVRGPVIQTVWLLALALTVAAGILLISKFKPPLPIRILAVTVPLVCGVAYTLRLIGDLARLDELQLRIQLEAAATACLGVFIAAMVYPIFLIAGFVGPLQSHYVIFLLVALLLVGYLNANRRYR